MAEISKTAEGLIEKNKGQGVKRLESSNNTLFREGFTETTMKFLGNKKNIDQFHWQVTLYSMKAVVEYVTGCCVFDGSPFKNRMELGDATPQILHTDVEYAKRIPVRRNAEDIGYAIADVLHERYCFNSSSYAYCVYNEENLPTKLELECLTERQMLALMYKCLYGKGRGTSGARRSVSGDEPMSKNVIYQIKSEKVEYKETTVKDLGLDDSVASAVTSFFSNPKHDMDYPMLVLIPKSHNRVVYPREYEGTIEKYQQEIIKMEDSKLVVTPFMWTTILIVCCGTVVGRRMKRVHRIADGTCIVLAVVSVND